MRPISFFSSQDDITREFDRLRSEGVNPAKAMWKASSAANKKRSMRDIERKQASHGDFAASAVAMFKDADTDEREGADGVVRDFPIVSAVLYLCCLLRAVSD